MRLKRMTSGNVFKIINETEVRYFQYFYTDQNYLGGDLIWVLNLKEETDDLDIIIESGYDFCFYTTLDAGVKLKKWELVGNIEIPKKMEYYPTFLWIEGDTRDWYLLTFDKKVNLGKLLPEKYEKIPVVPFAFPKQSVEMMILGYKYLQEHWHHSRYQNE